MHAIDAVPNIFLAEKLTDQHRYAGYGEVPVKIRLVIGTAILLFGCTIERVGPPGVTLTRAIRVKAQDVRVFEAAADVDGHFTVVDTVWIKDDGDTLPRVMERQLRELAGARGANAIINDPLNRKLNGTRVDLRPTLEAPFEFFSATAIWIGAGERPEKHLGTLGGRGQ